MGLLCIDADKAAKNIIGLDMAINVHCGLTYSSNNLHNIEDNLLGELWWFGFDTAHAGDIRPIQTEVDRKYPHEGDTYKDLAFVQEETKSLAKQLASFIA